MDFLTDLLLAQALAAGLAQHLAEAREQPPPENFYVLPPDPEAWRKLKATCKENNTVICIEVTDDSHPPSRRLQGPVMDLARDMEDVPFFRVKIAFGRTFDELRESLGGVKITPTLLVVYFDVDDKIAIYKAEGVLEVRSSLQTGKAKAVMKLFLEKRTKIKIAEKLAEHFVEALQEEAQRQRERAQMQYRLSRRDSLRDSQGSGLGARPALVLRAGPALALRAGPTGAATEKSEEKDDKESDEDQDVGSLIQKFEKFLKK